MPVTLCSMTTTRLAAAVLFSLALGAPLGAVAADAPYDLVIRNARIVDGTGSPWFRSAVAVRGDTIVAVAPSLTGPAKRVIDAKGLVVSPGFIDIHTHVGGGMTKERAGRVVYGGAR